MSTLIPNLRILLTVQCWHNCTNCCKAVCAKSPSRKWLQFSIKTFHVWKKLNPIQNSLCSPCVLYCIHLAPFDDTLRSQQYSSFCLAHIFSVHGTTNHSNKLSGTTVWTLRCRKGKIYGWLQKVASFLCCMTSNILWKLDVEQEVGGVNSPHSSKYLISIAQPLWQWERDQVSALIRRALMPGCSEVLDLLETSSA